MKKSILILGLSGLLNLTACGGGAGGPADSANPAAPSDNVSETVRPAPGTGGTDTGTDGGVGDSGSDTGGSTKSEVPAITGVQVLGFVAPDGFEAVRELKDGDDLDLTRMPNLINIEAVSEDSLNTGSVSFVLEGPASMTRTVNQAKYTLDDPTDNLDIDANELPEGAYLLTVTPYGDADASGIAGEPVTLTFTVVKSVEVDETATGPQATATDDNYSTNGNEALTVNADTGVMSNDVLPDSLSGQVASITQPEHGSVVLHADGSLDYTPDHNFAGIDSFDYTLTDASGNESSARVTVTVEEIAPEANGFTPIVASDDTRTVYVSSSEGLDSNSGLDIGAPVKTLRHAFSLVRDGFPDHVLLKRGDVWVDERLDGAKSGRSKSEPAVIAFYGDSGDRPKLKTSDYTLYSDGFSYVSIMGLEIEAYKLNPADPAFDGTTSANIRMVGEFKDILFEDVKMRFVEFVIQGWNGSRPRDIHIRRSIILDKYSAGTSYSRDSRPSGIYTDSGEGLLIEDSLWDHNGWNAEVPGAGANMYNHNMYISERDNVGNKIVVRNNIVTRASALGIHGRPGGTYENNFFGRNAIGMQMGYNGGPALSAGTIAHARDNVVTEGLNMDRGIDSCSGDNLCTKAIWGIQVENLGEADVRVEGNIVSSRLFEYEGYVSGIRNEGVASYSDNIVYKWDSEGQGTDAGYPDPDRTLADYNASIGGEHSFLAFIETARNRGLQEWDERYTADAINDYIRAGFGR